MNILILGHENCNLIYNLSKGLYAMGHKIDTAILHIGPFFPESNYTYVLNKPERKSGNKYVTKLVHWKELALWKVKRSLFSSVRYYSYDLYIFTWTTLNEDLSDLYDLYSKGKKIIFLFIGSDIRWIEAFRQEYPDNSYKGFQNEDWIRKFILARSAELCSTAIFSVPDQSGLLIRGYYHMFMPLDLTTLKYNPVTREIPLIIHAPSKSDLKGTDLILKALEQLKSQGVQFRFEFIQGLDNSQLMRKLEDADILIDQLYGNGPGTLAAEAMAAGCAVATRFFREYELTAKAPMCYIDEHTIVEPLRKLITDMNYRKDFVNRSRSYVEEYNSVHKVAERVLDSIDRDAKNDHDYKPSFFLEKFVLPKQYQYPEQIKELNQKVSKKFNKEYISK